MKNLEEVVKATKNATYTNSVSLYYDEKTDTAFAGTMLTDEQKEEYFYCTELIRECSEHEVQSFVYRFLWM